EPQPSLCARGSSLAIMFVFLAASLIMVEVGSFLSVRLFRLFLSLAIVRASGQWQTRHAWRQLGSVRQWPTPKVVALLSIRSDVIVGWLSFEPRAANTATGPFELVTVSQPAWLPSVSCFMLRWLSVSSAH